MRHAGGTPAHPVRRRRARGPRSRYAGGSILSQFSQRLNLMDRLNAPGNSAPHTATEMNFGLRSAGNGRLARHGRPGQGSTYLRTALNAQSPLGRRHEAHPGISQFSQRLNLMDRLNAPGNSAPHTATEMNFGLRSAGNGRLARHGRPGQGSTYLRTALNAQSPLGRRHEAHPGI